MADEFSQRYDELLQGSYDCVDRIVLNAYSLGHSAGGFREWWRRLHHGSEENLDNAHLMRMAGRFSRRLRGFARTHGIPIIDCRRGERKHRIAEDYLAKHTVKRGLFLILVGRAMASVWEVHRSARGVVQHLEKKRPYINHYSFHIMDPDWGHITIKMAGHPPFGAQIILNGHEYVACQATKRHFTFTKEGNCFTAFAEPVRLARIADTLSDVDTIGRLIQVCERWIYSACLCFALDFEEQERTRFRYGYTVYQVEYSRNLLFEIGPQMEQVFERMVDHTRAKLDVPHLRTIFGAKRRPRQMRRHEEPRLAVVVETLEYGLSVYKVHFGNLTLKAYTKSERVLRFEAVVHNTRDLGCGRVVERFPEIVARLEAMLERFMTTLDCVDTAFISDGTLDRSPLPSFVGKTRVGGVDMNKWRTRTTLAAVLALASGPTGFTVAELTSKVRAMTGQQPADYTVRQAVYDVKKLRGKGLLHKVGKTRRYQVRPHAMRAIAAMFILRDHVIAPILAGVRSPRLGRKPPTWTLVDRHYEQLRIRMQPLFHELGIAHRQFLVVPALASRLATGRKRYPRKQRARTRRMNTRWLRLRPPEQLDEEERNALQRVLDEDPPLATAHALMQPFRRVVRERDLPGLDRWLADTAASELPPFVGFTRGIAVDRDTVVAAFSMPWSTGPVEGRIHKIKLLKRKAYGRAALPQLRACILAA